MNYIEIEKEIEERRCLAEDVRRKMADYERSMDRISTRLFNLSINGPIPRASALHLMLGAAEGVNLLMRQMDEAMGLSEKCVLMPEGGFWKGNIDQSLEILYSRTLLSR